MKNRIILAMIAGSLTTMGCKQTENTRHSGRSKGQDATAETPTSWTPPSSTAPSTPPAEEPTETGKDSFGVLQIYKTRTDGTPTWEIGVGNWQDRLDDRADTVDTPDGVGIKIGGKARINVKAHPDSDGEKGKDHMKVIEQGYMDRPEDWRNFEVTAKTSDANFDGDDFTIYGRGGRHTNPQPYCPGFAYKGSIGNEGKSRFAKEQAHVDYDHTDYESTGVKVAGNEIYHKFVVYNLGENNTPPVVVEWWVSEDDGKSFKKINEAVDNDDWGEGNGEVCNRPRKKAMTGGGPVVTFRTDEGGAILTHASVRDIVPPKEKYEVGDVVKAP
jgi:hypothetical protein